MELSSTMRKMVRVRKIGRMDLRTIKDSTRTVNTDLKATTSSERAASMRENSKTANSKARANFRMILK